MPATPVPVSQSWLGLCTGCVGHAMLAHEGHLLLIAALHAFVCSQFGHLYMLS